MEPTLISQLRYSDAEQSPHSHYHLSCEMVLVCEGEAEFVIDGRRYPAAAGSIVFISSYEQHEIHIRKMPYRRYFAMVQATEMERLFPASVLPGIFRNRPAGFTHCVSLRAFGDEPERIFARLAKEWESSAPYARQMVKNLLEQLLILVYRACPQNFTALENNTGSRIRDIRQYIEQHFAEDLKIAQIARKFYINHSYLTHVFRQQVGYSPKQYILLNRLSYAQELLETTQLQVSQIAYRCGFGDVNNFIRAFRAFSGLSPNQFRQQRGQGAVPPSLKSGKAAQVNQARKEDVSI